MLKGGIKGAEKAGAEAAARAAVKKEAQTAAKGIVKSEKAVVVPKEVPPEHAVNINIASDAAPKSMLSGAGKKVGVAAVLATGGYALIGTGMCKMNNPEMTDEDCAKEKGKEIADFIKKPFSIIGDAGKQTWDDITEALLEPLEHMAMIAGGVVVAFFVLPPLVRHLRGVSE